MLGEKQLSGAKEAAEKGLIAGVDSEKHPSGAEAHVDFAVLAARLKSCPFKTMALGEFFRSL